MNLSFEMVSFSDPMPIFAVYQEKLSKCYISQLATCFQCGTDHVLCIEGTRQNVSFVVVCLL